MSIHDLLAGLASLRWDVGRETGAGSGTPLPAAARDQRSTDVTVMGLVASFPVGQDG
jgi:hypothetical protein